MWENMGNSCKNMEKDGKIWEIHVKIWKIWDIHVNIWKKMGKSMEHSWKTMETSGKMNGNIWKNPP